MRTIQLLYSKAIMITRGHLIGEIVDGLTTISQQVSTRCQLGLTDLNRYLEDFFKDFLNEALALSLVNLNDERSNEPGLDLGDEGASVAYQITSTKTAQKVNKTLEITSERKVQFDEVYVLIIGKKQSSYKLEKAFAKKLGFTEKNILDVDDLCKKTISLPLDRLQALHDLVRRNLTRVRIELEIPDEDGNFATSIDSYIEKLPKPTLSNFKKYYAYQKDFEEAFEHTHGEVKDHFKNLSKELSQLPRITREFYAFLLERREKDDNKTPSGVGYSGNLWFNYNKLRRVCRFPDMKDELILLEEHGFADIEEPMEHNESPFVRIFVPLKAEGFIYELVEYIEAHDIGYKKPIVSLDFSEF
ncbi:SMEK domain-containing protein [Shewanella algae]|uniref:SMEK domain-containing protein n=1 Tax=Shewanella algae TaxID=38313 RepID=UPI001BF0EAF6|nr:SMEK domain-containing protein [Shewanella algae]BCV50338.1 hypothetical protein TUM17382_30310 [Shewanella algae]